jgi:RHS repeat-associated protein
MAGYGNGSQTPTEYKHSDWLGSVRFSSTPARTLNYDVAFAPFGEPYASGHIGNIFAAMTQVVTGDEYETPNREYHTTQGRWISPDPAGMGAVNPANPQTWNRYSYVGNNPLNAVDPSGLACYPLEKQMFGTCAPFMNNGVNFGGNWNSFYNMEAAFTPTKAILVPDPEFPFSDNNTLYLIFGRIGLLNFTGGGPNVTIGPAPIEKTPSEQLKPGCTSSALGAGLKAAAGDFFSPPGADPIGDVGDALRDKNVQRATVGVLYVTANALRPLAPALDVAADFVPFVGEAVLTYQVLSAVYAGGKAYKASIDQCYGD